MNRITFKSLVTLAIVVGVLSAYKIDHIADNQFKNSELNSFLSESVELHGVSMSFRDGLEEHFEIPTKQQIDAGINQNGKLLASIMASGSIDGELSHRLSSCPYEVVTLIDSSATKDVALDYKSCFSELTKLRSCSLPAEEFVKNPDPCISSLGVSGWTLRATAKGCTEDINSMSCTAYKRLAAKLSYMSKALGV